MVTFSIGSCSVPSISLVTTRGLPTVNSKPSRRIISTSTANCSSPRPCTSHASGRSVSATRSETLPINSESSRFLISRAVILLPCPPARGDVLVPMVTEMLGSSTVITGRGRGSFGSARVSPIVISGIPATAMMSPGPAWSTGLRSKASVMSRSLTFALVCVPSARHHVTCWPLRMVPAWMRHTAKRPK